MDGAKIAALAESALFAPTAGNTAGVRFLVVDQPALPGYFAVATDENWRENAPRAAGLLRAGAAVLVTSRPQDYAARYAEADKASSGLGDPANWPLPYWHTDAAMATMALLLLLEGEGLQATLWGNFRNEEAVLAWAGLTDERLFATLLIGHGDGNDRPSASLSRAVPSRAERVRRRVEP